MNEGAIVDVDGVCADFVGGLEKSLGRKFTADELKEWEFIKKLPPDEKRRVYGICADPDFWRNLDVVKGAKEGVKYLESLGLHIIWATSPWSSCEGWADARRDWLNRHFQMDSKKHSYVPGSDKAQIEGDFIIDDKPDNVKEWMTAHPGKKAFIFDALYNRNFHDATRFTWAKVKNLV